MAVKFIHRADGNPGYPPQDLVVTSSFDFTATALTPVDGTAFVADQDYELVKVIEAHSVAGAGASTLDLKKCTGTTAPASGTTMMAAASNILLDSTANTPVTKVLGGASAGTTFTASTTTGLAAVQATRRVTTGDRICYDFSGTLTAYNGVIQLHLRRIGSSNDQVGF